LKLNTSVGALALACAAVNGHAQQFGAIKVEHPYARATAPGQPNGGGYMTLVNSGTPDRLVSVSGDIARAVELHEMRIDADVMRMRQVDGIELPAGKTVELKPGGYHVMLVGLKAPLKVGQTFALKLTFENAGQVGIDVTVEAPSGLPEMKH
jgi:copper(I)-binding protein